MRLKISDLLTSIWMGYLLTSIHILAQRPVINSISRLFRVATIPVLVAIIIILLPQQSMTKMKRFFFLYLPPIVLLTINLFQLIALPPEVLPTHITGSTKFTAWFALYFAMILNLNTATVGKIRARIFTMLAITFAVGILQYPYVIAQAGGNLITALTNYGQLASRYQLSGIFGSANEDANGLVTLMPLAFLWIETQTKIRKPLLRAALFLYFPTALVFNGTRTALLISFPILSALFYLKIPVKKVIYLAGPVAAAFFGFLFASQGLIARVFAEESAGGGSLGWRISHAWEPAIDYTLSHAPLFGFGSRGWEYVGEKLVLLTPVTNEVIPSHSGYVWAFTCWGAVGLLTYLLFLLILLLEAFSLSRSDNREVALAGKAMLASVVGYCFWAFISNVMWAQGWIVLISLGLLIACVKTMAYATVDAPPTEHRTYVPTLPTKRLRKSNA